MKTSFSWNLVTKNVPEEPLFCKKLRQKIGKLEKHLKYFPPDAVHLQIVLEKHPKKPLHTVEVTLRVPSNVLHAEKSAPGLIEAFDEAIRAILRELARLKADLRRERFWKRKTRREQLREVKAGGFAAAPQPPGVGPQKFEDVVHDFFKRHYNALVAHAQRDIRHDEQLGEVPLHTLDPREIVDEAARQAEAKAARKPRQMSWIVWCYHLLHEELRRERNQLKREQAEEIPIEKRKTLPENSENALQPLEAIVQKEMEPEVTRMEDLLPNPEALPPDRAAEQIDSLEHLQEVVRHWPRPQREVFELHFVQGFEPDEVAMILGLPLKTVLEHISAMGSWVREEMLHEEVA